MNDKREIGKKIWELFSKNYSYGEIAKELGVSKSVVSNVINYSLPSKDWAQKDIKKIKEECEKNCEEEVNELEEELQKEILETKISSIITSVFTTIIIFGITIKLFQNFNNFNMTIKMSIAIISLIIIFIISFFSANLMKKYLYEI